MRRKVGGFLLLLSLLACAPVYAAGVWTLYDNFSSGIINPDKWYGSEYGKTGRESQRTVVSKQLNLSERCYGNTESNVGAPYSEQSLRFNNASNLRGIKALVKPVKFQAVGCDSNTNTAWAYARLFGRFFNTDPQGPNSSTNDVYAYIAIRRDSLSLDAEDTARIQAIVRQCIDDNCTNYTTLFIKDLDSIKQGQSATLSVEWDKAKHRFLFQRDANKSLIFAYDPHEYPDTFSPVSNIKFLSVLSRVPNCTATPRSTGLMNTLFDNVYIKTFSP